MAENNPKIFSIGKNFEYDLMFIGKVTHKLRKQMIDQYTKLFGDKFKYFDKFVDWKTEYNNEKFICAPRGVGRNSFRLTSCGCLIMIQSIGHRFLLSLTFLILIILLRKYKILLDLRLKI